MSRITLMAVCALSLCLALAPADQPAAPKSLAARTAIAKHQKALKDAKSDYDRAVEDANATLKTELDKALKIALKNENLDEANAIKGVATELPEKISENEPRPQLKPSLWAAGQWDLTGRKIYLRTDQVAVHELTDVIGVWYIRGDQLVISWNTNVSDIFPIKVNGQRFEGKNSENGPSVLTRP